MDLSSISCFCSLRGRTGKPEVCVSYHWTDSIHHVELTKDSELSNTELVAAAMHDCSSQQTRELGQELLRWECAVSLPSCISCTHHVSPPHIQQQKMVPDPLFFMSTDCVGGPRQFEDSGVPADIHQSPRMLGGNRHTSLPLNSVKPSGHSAMDLLRARMMKPGLVSSSAAPCLNDGDPFLQDILKYINQTLMEENLEEGFIAKVDPSTLQATENALSDVLEKKYTTSSISSQQVGILGGYPSRIDADCIGDSMDELAAVFNQRKSASNQWNTLSDTAAQSYAQHVSSCDIMPGLRQVRESEEVRADLSRSIHITSDVDENPGYTDYPNVVNCHSAKKNREREDSRLQKERDSKQSTCSTYLDVTKLSEAFDEIFLCYVHRTHFPGLDRSHGKADSPRQSFARIKHTRGSNARGGRPKKGRSGGDVVDLRNLLMLCAQATSVSDLKEANEQIKQIRLHSSPTGDGSQRMAHYLANALEARIAGSAAQNIFTSLMTTNAAASNMFSTYKVFFYACPFVKIGFAYTNNMILNAAKGAKVLHVIDYGILFGFKWPSLIQLLSMRPGGPPKLRITGIELPRQGFKPAERLYETGRNLEWYCQRFNVPFEFNAVVSSKWETIKLEELKLCSDEVVVVNSFNRLSHLADETIMENNPRDAVLKFVRELRPKLFVLSVINGSFNSPFFVTRFREAMFHFSALYDMMDANVSRDSEERMTIEREYYGRQVMNVISCEGLERVERPETYKQWQVRITQAGFQRLHLDRSLIEIFRDVLALRRSKDFHIDEDDQWMLQGWKGRILYASSSWVTK